MLALSRSFRTEHILYMLSVMSTLAIALAVGVQPLFLDEVLKIPFEKAGTINAHLTVVTEMISLFVVGYTGFRYGRTFRAQLIFYGFLCILIGSLLAPWSGRLQIAIGVGGLAFYYLMRTLISIGTNTVQMETTTWMGDVSVHDHKPKLMLGVISMMVLGSTILYSIIIQIPHDTGTVNFVLALPILVGLAGALLTRYNLHKTTRPGTELKERPYDRIWSLVTGDARMQLCFAASFYTRADMIVVSLFLSLWLNSMADMVGASRLYATAHAAGLMGVVGASTLISIPVWIRFMEHHSRVAAIGAALALSGLGFVMLAFVVNPFQWIVVLPLIVIGMGSGGALIAPKVLANDLAPKDILGPLQGLFFLTGGIGLVLMVQSGGYYFDAVGPSSPFILMGTGNLLFTLYAVWLILKGFNENAQHEILEKKHKTKLNLKPMIFMASTLPLIWLVGRVLMSGYVPGNSVGQMPVGFINRYLGDWAFNFLLFSLALRPIYEITGVKKLAQYSRMIGLYAFFYALLHVLTYLWLEWIFNWHEIVDDVTKRSFILLGVIAFLIMIVLAATSHNQIIRQMGGKRWKFLHKFTYTMNILVALHFIFAATHENGEAYAYASLVAVLLGYRAHQAWKRRNGTRDLQRKRHAILPT
ncbi:Ferric reductase domain protein transmembrane component, N-terminal domain [Magnetococcus marinus MC-1]|uniref:Protein-methionine-sulfoxide reductase heme-binding subunit MsrQ n=1 Tax=Magnetococcus marinus (strain ATCC BAA-1437 / JCM 17883 / MC-1) TaxID=156889 RepID=A0L9U7_MAGMM|nr:magnetosome biogenesis transporter MamZ [Magnetococcus marinus]ABK44740.1 Ferric reductase domain protein transmembrane component, N-terminal domain [Magnetococcus marinus MC-1]